MSKKSLPKYSFHKVTGQARVRLNGKDYWLGKNDSKESRQRYAELLLEWEQATDIAPSYVTFRQLSVMYNAHAQKHYVKNGKQASEVGLIVYSLQYMNRVCKKVLLEDVKPRHL